MHTVLVTGANGFIGRNLCVHLRTRPGLKVLTAHRETCPVALQQAVAAADSIIHLAGVNRPPHDAEFNSGNIQYTKRLATMISENRRKPLVVFASSIHAENESAYGLSKRRAEECLYDLSKDHPVTVSVLRLKNVFGKWCRPNYNSVVATFCHNIANSIPIEIHEPSRTIDLIFVDDVLHAIEKEMAKPRTAHTFSLQGGPTPETRISLADLASILFKFREMRTSLIIPDFSTTFIKQLYATYLSYVNADATSYNLKAHHDSRGSLAEFIKSNTLGQIFVSRTRPGVTRGNHYHNIKAEKFLVVEGEGLIQLRTVDNDLTVEHHVSGSDFRVVDIPPGHTHSIRNIGTTDMVTIFWACEIFDPNRPDTFSLPVHEPSQMHEAAKEGAA